MSRTSYDWKNEYQFECMINDAISMTHKHTPYKTTILEDSNFFAYKNVVNLVNTFSCTMITRHYTVTMNFKYTHIFSSDIDIENHQLNFSKMNIFSTLL